MRRPTTCTCIHQKNHLKKVGQESDPPFPFDKLWMYSDHNSIASKVGPNQCLRMWGGGGGGDYNA